MWWSSQKLRQCLVRTEGCWRRQCFALLPPTILCTFQQVKEPAFPRTWNSPISCLHEIIKGLSLIIELTCCVVLCIELELKQDMLNLRMCAELCVRNCLGNCTGNFLNFFFGVPVSRHYHLNTF